MNRAVCLYLAETALYMVFGGCGVRPVPGIAD